MKVRMIIQIFTVLLSSVTVLIKELYSSLARMRLLIRGYISVRSIGRGVDVRLVVGFCLKTLLRVCPDFQASFENTVLERIAPAAHLLQCLGERK